MIQHFELTLPAFSRGFHLIDQYILKAMPSLPVNGILHIFIHHTSAGLTINENCDPSVLRDFERFYNHMVPEGMAFVEHDMEGPDDMPAHIKSSMVGSSVSIPVERGQLKLGTWQGVYLCEFRNRARPRTLTISIYS